MLLPLWSSTSYLSLYSRFIIKGHICCMWAVLCSVLKGLVADDMTHNCSHTAKEDLGKCGAKRGNGDRMKLPNMTSMNVFFTMHKHNRYFNFKLPPPDSVETEDNTIQKQQCDLVIMFLNSIWCWNDVMSLIYDTTSSVQFRMQCCVCTMTRLISIKSAQVWIGPQTERQRQRNREREESSV